MNRTDLNQSYAAFDQAAMGAVVGTGASAAIKFKSPGPPLPTLRAQKSLDLHREAVRR
jgi:hypothetical protein